MHIMNSHEMDMRAYVPELHRKGLHILRIDGRHMDPKRCVLSQIMYPFKMEQKRLLLRK